MKIIRFICVLFVVLFALQCFAGQAGYVQTTNANVASTTATTLSITFTQATTATDLNCLAIGLDGANALTVTVSSVTDGGNTYSKVGSKTQSGTINEAIELWCASNIAAGKTAATITISGALGTNGGIQAMHAEYAGVDTGSVATITNITATGSSAASTSATASITPTANSLVIAAVNCSPVSAGSTLFRLRQKPAVGNGYEDRLNAQSGTTYTPTFTLASTDNYAMVAAAFTVTTGLTVGVADYQSVAFSSSPVSLSFDRVEAGDGIASVILLGLNTNTLTSVKDGALNVFTNSAHSPAAVSGAGAVYISYYGNETGGAQTITAVHNSTNPGVFWIYELFGTDTVSHTSMFDIDNKDIATSAISTTAPSMTTTGTDVAIEGAFACNTITGVSNSWINGGAVINSGLSAFKNNLASATYNANFTQNSSGCWATVLAAFKGAGGAVAPKCTLAMLNAGPC